MHWSLQPHPRTLPLPPHLPLTHHLPPTLLLFHTEAKQRRACNWLPLHTPPLSLQRQTALYTHAHPYLPPPFFLLMKGPNGAGKSTIVKLLVTPPRHLQTSTPPQSQPNYPPSNPKGAHSQHHFHHHFHHHSHHHHSTRRPPSSAPLTHYSQHTITKSPNPVPCILIGRRTSPHKSASWWYATPTKQTNKTSNHLCLHPHKNRFSLGSQTRS